MQEFCTSEIGASVCELPPVHNFIQTQVLVWWPTATEEAWPWTPVMGERERANVALFSCNGQVACSSVGG